MIKRHLIMISLVLLASITHASEPATPINLNVSSRIHFNTNVSNFEASRAFYGFLGFETLSGFPDTNTLAMAEAIGVKTPTSYDGSQGDWAGGYLLHGELIGVNDFSGGLIDLIEFTIPRNEAPPYQQLNHLGMVYAAMYTLDIDDAYRRMTGEGISFVSPPFTSQAGARFAFFTDPDGTFYKLTEAASGSPKSGSIINRLGHIGINVTSLEASTDWYRMFGYEVSQEFESEADVGFAKALGFDQPVTYRGVRLVNDSDGSEIELTQWLEPFDASPPYPLPVNHLGIHRTALTTTDIEGDVAQLQAAGVRFVSPITPCCSGPDASGKIVAFFDPDGVIVELAAQPWYAQYLFRAFLWVRGLFSG